MSNLRIWSRNRHALSPIFATVLLASTIIVFGSVAFYYSNNLTTTATNDYVNTLANSQQAISERIGFENVVYTTSSPATLTVYIINCGSANSVQIGSVFLYDASHNIAGAYSGSAEISTLHSMGTPIMSNSLNAGQEGYFIVSLGAGTYLTNSVYTIHLVTQSGGTFDYEFTP